MKKALGLIKKTWVDRWYYWEIQSQELNSVDWPEHVGYFGPRGGKLAKLMYGASSYSKSNSMRKS